MPFEKGRAKTGGRQKGTRNKIGAEVREYLEKSNFDVLGGLIALIQRTEKEEYTGGVAMRGYIALLERLYPALKSTEMNVNQLRRIEVEVTDGRVYRIGEIEASREAEPSLPQ